MATLLHIDASARSERSISRELSACLVRQWLASHPDDKIIYRDIGVHPPGFLTEDWIAACFASASERSKEQIALLEESDTLISELEESDVIVLGTPMYNYSIPAALKAWIDRVIRVEKTFTFDLSRGDFPLQRIMSGKKMVCITSKGEFGFNIGGIRETMNHLDPYIKTIAPYLGVEQLYFVSVEYQEFRDARHEASRSKAEHAIDQLLDRLTTENDYAG